MGYTEFCANNLRRKDKIQKDRTQSDKLQMWQMGVGVYHFDCLLDYV